jgi:hypothetical protein
VHDRILKRIRTLVRLRSYVMTTHADEEADEDSLTIFDIESAILTGSVVERQRDSETREWKYVIKGETLDERNAVVVLKFGLVRRLYILTVYEE